MLEVWNIYIFIYNCEVCFIKFSFCENDKKCTWKFCHLINIHYHTARSRTLSSFQVIPAVGVVREEHAYSLTPQHGTHRPVAALVCLTAAAERQLRATMMTSPPSHHPKYLQTPAANISDPMLKSFSVTVCCIATLHNITHPSPYLHTALYLQGHTAFNYLM